MRNNHTGSPKEMHIKYFLENLSWTLVTHKKKAKLDI